MSGTAYDRVQQDGNGIYDANEWERKVQNPTAMLVEKMRHLSGCTSNAAFFPTKRR